MLCSLSGPDAAFCSRLTFFAFGEAASMLCSLSGPDAALCSRLTFFAFGEAAFMLCCLSGSDTALCLHCTKTDFLLRDGDTTASLSRTPLDLGSIPTSVSSATSYLFFNFQERCSYCSNSTKRFCITASFYLVSSSTSLSDFNSFRAIVQFLHSSCSPSSRAAMIS